MLKSSKDIFEEKVDLIYKNQKNTPLFLNIAKIEFDNKKYSLAAEIINKGIEHYPNYSAAFFLLSRVYTQLQKFDLALEALNKGNDILQNKKTYDFYLNEINFFKNQHASNTFQKDFQKLSAEEVNHDFRIVIQDEDDSYLDNDEFTEQSTTNLASETLAKIYVAQGEIEEAIKTYYELIEKIPANKNKYLETIQELKKRL